MTRRTNVLVTGGAGFIGSNLVDRLLHEGYEVRVIDNLFSSSRDNLAHIHPDAAFQFIHGDIRDRNLLSTTLQDSDVVFHEAAQRNVAFSIREPLLTHEINVTGTLQLLNTCIKLNVKKLILASSAAVYGIPQTRITEDTR